MYGTHEKTAHWFMLPAFAKIADALTLGPHLVCTGAAIVDTTLHGVSLAGKPMVALFSWA
jgi:hypothetical protein